jgi:(p)ppGpp synthase/HD superfamily hydrolase
MRTMSVDRPMPDHELDADALAARLLGTARTRLGGLHIDHARRVAVAMGDVDPRVRAVALLHDVVEKSGTSIEALESMTGDPWITEMVGLLSKHEGESEQDYLARCAADPVALQIKRLDIGDKLVTDDVHLPADEAERVRAQARERLLALESLAPQNARQSGAAPSRGAHDRATARKVIQR